MSDQWEVRDANREPEDAFDALDQAIHNAMARGCFDGARGRVFRDSIWKALQAAREERKQDLEVLRLAEYWLDGVPSTVDSRIGLYDAVSDRRASRHKKPEKAG